MPTELLGKIEGQKRPKRVLRRAHRVVAVLLIERAITAVYDAHRCRRTRGVTDCASNTAQINNGGAGRSAYNMCAAQSAHTRKKEARNLSIPVTE